MKDIVKRLKQINDESLIMEVVYDCMDAAEEIEALRAECAKKSEALKQIKTITLREEQSAAARRVASTQAKPKPEPKSKGKS